MHALPILLSLPVAAALAPATLRLLTQGGHLRANYRGRKLPVPLGVLVLLAGLATLAPLALIQRLTGTGVLPGDVAAIVAFVCGVGALGLIDDAFGDGGPRGLRGHVAALLEGRIGTGAIKASGVAGLALLAVSGQPSTLRWLLAAAVLTLSTHAFNLLDLRPGRASKALLVLGAGLTIGSARLSPLLSLGAFLGPALIAGLYDLREKAMLGDTGAGMLGALAGLWIVQTVSPAGQLAALGVLAFIAVYGELRSISELVERTPWLRQLDSLGRPS